MEAHVGAMYTDPKLKIYILIQFLSELKHWDYQRIHGSFLLRERDIVLLCNSLSKTRLFLQINNLKLNYKKASIKPEGFIKILHYYKSMRCSYRSTYICTHTYLHTHTVGEGTSSKVTSF